MPDTQPGYYGRPVLKAPVWTWEVPTYFFVGGAAGAAAVIAVVARLAGADPLLVRHARWIAGIGAVLSPLLLISDLGRPARFLNMLRVFKLQSPMSIGVWTLVVFSGAVALSILLDALAPATGASLLVAAVSLTTDLVALATGLILATYTGVLIGATTIPVWSAHVQLLPIHFGASALGAAVSIVELIGHRTAAMNVIGIGAAAVETLVAIRLEVARDAATRILRAGPSGVAVRGGGALTGPVPLLLRLMGPASAPLRVTAALSAVVGSLVARFGWVAAGRRAAAEPALVLEARTGG
jgi:formate-dependent nitrite reductase membrane component NrfD